MYRETPSDRVKWYDIALGLAFVIEVLALTGWFGLSVIDYVRRSSEHYKQYYAIMCVADMIVRHIEDRGEVPQNWDSVTSGYPPEILINGRYLCRSAF